MLKPTSRYFDNHHKTSFLYFDDGSIRESYMRAGICFPVRYQTMTGAFGNHGFIIAAGQDVKTGKVHVYDGTPWVAIDDILDKDNRVEYPGLSHWLNKTWGELFLQTFYFHQPDEMSRRYRLQILRSQMVVPKPRIVELPPVDVADMLSAIWHFVKTGAIEIESGSDLAIALAPLGKNNPVGGQLHPAVHALGCCLIEIERFPWRAPYEKPIIERLVPLYGSAY